MTSPCWQVRSDVANQLPSGGHQGYAACGGLYTQCPPNDLHLYGTVIHQFRNKAVRLIRSLLVFQTTMFKGRVCCRATEIFSFQQEPTTTCCRPCTLVIHRTLTHQEGSTRPKTPSPTTLRTTTRSANHTSRRATPPVPLLSAFTKAVPTQLDSRNKSLGADWTKTQRDIFLNELLCFIQYFLLSLELSYCYRKSSQLKSVLWLGLRFTLSVLLLLGVRTC